jgi:pteridine reductase
VERPLEGRVALVTGGGIRVGRAIAEALGAAGANVAVHYATSRQGAEDVVARIRADGNRAVALKADLAEGEEGAERLLREAGRELGPVDVLVNSAGLLERASLEDTSAKTLDRLWSLNARAPYLLTRAFVQNLQREKADVVNVVDVGGGRLAWKRYSAYCMTKAALAMLTRCLAVELAPRVRVNAVAPGTVLPPTWLGAEELEALRKRIPAGRFGSPEDVARTVLFLLTGPSFVTGELIGVDGGRSASAGG